MRTPSKLTAMAFRKVDFGLFKDLLGRVQWDRAPERRGAQESLLVFNDSFIQAWEQCIQPKERQDYPNCMDEKDLLDKLKHKKEAQRRRNQLNVAWEEKTGEIV